VRFQDLEEKVEWIDGESDEWDVDRRCAPVVELETYKAVAHVKGEYSEEVFQHVGKIGVVVSRWKGECDVCIRIQEEARFYLALRMYM
jgi:hypothetical protein